MTSRDFCFWLQGLFELSDCDLNKSGVNDTLSSQQVAKIKAHLSLVFKHEIDPSMGNQAHQDVLNEIHSNLKPNSDVILRC